MSGSADKYSVITNVDGNKNISPETKGTTNSLPVFIVDSSGNQIEAFDPAYHTVVTSEDSSSRLEYIGIANIGSSESSSVWRIIKITYHSSGNIESVKWADGNSLMDNSWSNRTSITYS